ncbi:MAP-ous protein 1 [Echria macrotheca]|uniref:MAP-ous protein 1 n=1 Tax=Echria macrotheca TaxID=438768 RepID=A0AAJ0BJ80_9PEZI|nr:MAP-ous protein 1 [Echria macrotheca]
MEQIHGVDVSWMTHGNPKATKATTRRRSISQTARDAPSTPPSPSPASPPPSNGTPTETPTRPPLGRTGSDDKRSPATQRRGSWFSNISSKFSSGSTASQSPPQANTAQPKPAELSVPRANPVKNAVLQHATKHEGEGPYTPAPPRSSQAGILHVFRRLSSSNGTLSTNVKPSNHGLVERRVLNVDQHRERCGITGLHQAKLRRVAFCVDVEVAPMPKYAEGDSGKRVQTKADKADKDQKRKIKEKGEGEALKNPKAVECQKEEDGEVAATGETVPKEPMVEGTETAPEPAEESRDAPSAEKAPDKADSKKKEKKKKSEEERKARKEKKRKLAEANGTIPMELHLDSGDESSSSNTVPPPEKPKTQATPTTNPVRIYRRCCQLRETPILKKITEQLTDPNNSSADLGMVEKLDLTGYWLQLPDLVTLGDYLAVVPVREVIMENCGLTDEGVRVILAGLLAAKRVAMSKKRRPLTEPDGLVQQGGVVERVVLKNNKLGPEGWRHISLFLYLCRTLKSLDLTGIPFPRPASGLKGNSNGTRPEQDLAAVFSKALGERLGGSTISLLNLGQIGLSTEQLGVLMDGVIKCGVRRLSLAHNDIDPAGVEHVARFIQSGVCEGLDLGGNDLRDQLGVLAEATQKSENNPLWALGLADCNLKPGSLCKLLPKLVKLPRFRFIDLSHNHDLFSSEPSAVSVLRRYLPKMQALKRIHLADCSMNSEQVIALAEILPEIQGLAHINFMENPALVELATNANTDETKEEACALYASLLAAVRVTPTLLAVDIEVPSEQSSDLVKAMAKHVVAHCLRNVELAAATAGDDPDVPVPDYPEALQRLVGHDAMLPAELDSDTEAAPDEDYVIGGTGLVKALACCLKNRGDESRRQSGEFIRDVENGIPIQQRPSNMPGGKAKETSKHLLSSARKIRHRIQPAIRKARTVAGGETHAYHRLIFLDNTLQGIIKRFEDEFPDTREAADSAIVLSSSYDANEKPLSASLSSAEGDGNLLVRETSAVSDMEDEADTDIKPALNRTNSMLSLSSKALANEEGRVLRAGHKFRVGIVKPEHYALLSSVEMVGQDPNHVRMLYELLDELNDDGLRKEVEEKGVVRVFEERRGEIITRMKALDPQHWDRFVESQVMARKNVDLGGDEAVY